MDNPVLRLFVNPGPVETPTPGGAAWLATDPGSGNRVLIKRMPGLLGKGRATDALGLDHPGIVRCRRWMVFEGNLWVVRDIVRGRNLRQHLTARGERPDAEGLRALMTPVLDALAYAHARGVAHGGLSYENILVADDGGILVSDFGSTDPAAPAHEIIYGGQANLSGDVRAMGKLIAALLPTSGPFASPVVRSRIEGQVLRADSLAALRDLIARLEALALAPTPRAVPRPDAAPADSDLADFPQGEGADGMPPPLPGLTDDPFRPLSAPAVAPGIEMRGTPMLQFEQVDRPVIAQGAGGVITAEVRNVGDATLLVRLFSAQHPWVNPRPTALPLVIPPGGSARIGFVVSAARLAPGEYRSEVYLSSNAPSKHQEAVAGGWYRHTSEIRARVVGGGGRW
ncbi:MAG: protein kinase domain-containing protein [Armatimonadota bacterium]